MRTAAKPSPRCRRHRRVQPVTHQNSVPAFMRAKVIKAARTAIAPTSSHRGTIAPRAPPVAIARRHATSPPLFIVQAVIPLGAKDLSINRLIDDHRSTYLSIGPKYSSPAFCRLSVPARASPRYHCAVRILFIVDPLERLHIAGDTSYGLMVEAAARGWDVWTCQVEHLGLVGDDAVVDAVPTIVTDALINQDAFQIEARVARRLADFDITMMRKDPPVDVSYLHATWILDHARGKTLLVNDPRGLRELNEHLAVLPFSQLTPPTIVTRSPERLRAFQREQGGAIVVKPVDGFGGLGIFVVRDGDPNASSIIETSTGAGTRWTLAQRFLPEVVQGDKRIVLVDGDPVGAVLRVPAEAESRGNLHVGGRAVKTEIDDRDREIIRQVAPFLAAHGQILVGLDVIGGMLTEINITSPTGIRQIARLENRNVAAEILDRLEVLAKLRSRPAT